MALLAGFAMHNPRLSFDVAQKSANVSMGLPEDDPAPHPEDAGLGERSVAETRRIAGSRFSRLQGMTIRTPPRSTG
jgi:hypothetical protein